MSFSGIVTKENVKSPELRGMKCKERPRHFFFFFGKSFPRISKNRSAFSQKKNSLGQVIIYPILATIGGRT